MKTATGISTEPKESADKKDRAALAYWNQVSHLYPKEKALENGFFRAVFAAFLAGIDYKENQS